MKRVYKKPQMKIRPCLLEKIEGDLSKMSEGELKAELERCGYTPAKYYANKNYIVREIAGESVLISVGEEITDFCGVVRMNSSAKVLWNALQEGKTKQELIELLQEVFHISADKARKDVIASLELLEGKGMVSYE